MFVGEIEFSDIPIDLDNGLWPLGYTFLLGFIFLIGKTSFSLTFHDIHCNTESLNFSILRY